MSLELENVSLTVNGETHIHPTDLALKAGAFNVLLGTTLAGKTTLMRLMAGLEKPSKGVIRFDSKDVTGQRVRQRNVAMVYQQFINYPNFTVYDNIASPMKIMGKSRKEIDDDIQQVAELLKLTPMLQRRPNELSGGQQQRIALARALVKKAKLVLLDEPLANLDYKLREELREELPKLFSDAGATVVYATTEPTEALLLGGYTATLHEGRVSQYGATAEVYRHPIDSISASVFSDPPMNMAHVTKVGSQLKFDSGVTWQAAGNHGNLDDGSYHLGVRPHHLTLSSGGAHSVQVDGQVLLTEISGSESTVHAVVGDQTWISLNHGVHSLEKGQTIPLFVDTRRCLLFDSNHACVGGSA